jgi:4-hydroxy-2-oxoheptanedioate aldolase
MASQRQPQAAWENPVRKLLREGKPVIGVTITAASPEVAAQAANLGFDFLWIEMEHSPITLETARNMILATRGLKAVPFTRVPVNELWTAKRVLDIGSLGVMFPFTSTPELARQAVAACKYPPEGLRGSGPRLATFRWPAPEGYHDFANRNVMVIIIIEQAGAVDQIDEIVAIPGIDAIFIGTSHIPVGRPAANAEQIEQYLKEGFLFFQGPADMMLMATGAQPLLQSLGKSGVDPRTQPLY